MPERVVDQLVIACVARSQAGPLAEQLNRRGFHTTAVHRARSSWGEVTLLIGADRASVPGLLANIREVCHPRPGYVPASVQVHLSGEVSGPMIEAEEGGAVLYVLDVERFERL